MKLCSACLLGIRCRYNGEASENKKVIELSKRETLIPVCPELLGGLSTPRESSEISFGKVFSISGKDVTRNFTEGAEETLKIARLHQIKEAILKQKSPSCGYGLIYDGSFKNNIIAGNGITAELLTKNGIRIISDDKI